MLVRIVLTVAFIWGFQYCKSKKICHIGLSKKEYHKIYENLKKSDRIYSYKVIFKGNAYYIDKIRWDKLKSFGMSEDEIPFKEKDILISADDCTLYSGGSVWDVRYSPLNCMETPEEQMTLADKLHMKITGPYIYYNMFKLNYLIMNPKEASKVMKKAVVYRDGKEMTIDLRSGKVLESKANRMAQRICEFTRLEKVEGTWISRAEPDNEIRIVNHYDLLYFFGKQNSEFRQGAFDHNVNYNVQQGIVTVSVDGDGHVLRFKFLNEGSFQIIEDSFDSFSFKKGEIFYRKSKQSELYVSEEEKNRLSLIEAGMK